MITVLIYKHWFIHLDWSAAFNGGEINAFQIDISDSRFVTAHFNLNLQFEVIGGLVFAPCSDVDRFYLDIYAKSVKKLSPLLVFW